MTNNIEIEDDFYTNYTFTHDFGHTKKDEIESVKELLSINEINPNNENTVIVLNQIRELVLLLDSKYIEDAEEYASWRRSQKMISGKVPATVIFAKKIWGIIISTGKGIKEIFTGSDEEEKIINKLIDKMEKNDDGYIVEVKKQYSVKKPKSN